MKKKISIIATFYNEEKCIKEFINRIINSFKKFKNSNYEIIFIDDCSSDNSSSIIKKIIKKNKKIKLKILKKRYGHSPSLQTGFDFVSKKNYVAVIDCDLQDDPELIAENLQDIIKNETIHFVREKREDPIFQKFYTSIAYKVLNFISQGKIFKETGYFKILSPYTVSKVKKNKEIDPYWNYLFTKYSTKNKIIYYTKKKRIHGSSKFTIFTLNPWLSFFSGIYCFKKRFTNIIFSLLIINLFFIIIFYYKFYNIGLMVISFLTFFILTLSLVILKILSNYKKNNKRIYCKTKQSFNF